MISTLCRTSFQDKQLGSLGFFVWITPVALFIFFLLFISSFFELIRSSGESINNILFILFGGAIFFIIALWLLYETKTALNIIQEIELSNNNINVVFYFRKKSNINISDIASVSLLDKNSFFLKKHRAVQTDKPCLEIKTKDSQSYLITPHMEQFDELKVALDKLVKEHN